MIIKNFGEKDLISFHDDIILATKKREIIYVYSSMNSMVEIIKGAYLANAIYLSDYRCEIYFHNNELTWKCIPLVNKCIRILKNDTHS